VEDVRPLASSCLPFLFEWPMIEYSSHPPNRGDIPPMTEEKITMEPYDKNPPSGQENRSQPRRRSRGKAFALFTIPPNRNCFRVLVRDASQSGISFLHDSPLEPETILALQFGAGLPGASWVRVAQVAHVTPRGQGWLIGCRISPPFSERELESI
jgi:hypothetical protein